MTFLTSMLRNGGICSQKRGRWTCLEGLLPFIPHIFLHRPKSLFVQNFYSARTLEQASGGGEAVAMPCAPACFPDADASPGQVSSVPLSPMCQAQRCPPAPTGFSFIAVLRVAHCFSLKRQCVIKTGRKQVWKQKLRN